MLLPSYKQMKPNCRVQAYNMYKIENMYFETVSKFVPQLVSIQYKMFKNTKHQGSLVMMLAINNKCIHTIVFKMIYIYTLSVTMLLVFLLKLQEQLSFHTS